MKSINEVLHNKTIEFNDEELSKFSIPNTTSNIFIKFKNFYNMISYHDFVDLSPNLYIYWTDFYKEKQEKLINDILCNDTIVFVRFCVNQKDLIENDIKIFFNNIERLNGKLNYYLILFSTDFLKISSDLLNNSHFYNLNFKLYNNIHKKYTNNIYNVLINSYDTKCFSDIIDTIKHK